MSTRLEFPEVFELPIEKKVQLAQDLWDDIAESTLLESIPPEILAELDCRRAEFPANPSIGLTIDQLKAKVMPKYAASISKFLIAEHR